MRLLGIDVGGTFTDLVAWDGQSVRTGKISTSVDQSEAVVAGAQTLSADTKPSAILHGSTIATNALLERTGARTALVTDPGFEDVLEIGRQDRPSLYDPDADRPQPLVPSERRLPAGHIEDLFARLSADRVEAVAVCLLYSFRDPAAEDELGRRLTALLPGLPISLSSRVAPEFREFERTSTTVLNAYLTPAVAAYLEQLASRLAAVGLQADVEVMRSSGGLMPLSQAAQLPAATLLSGPAGGVVASAALGEAMGHRHLISFDMGGTSTDVSRIDDARPGVSYQRSVDGYACQFPAVAVHTVGAGGGSLGWADPGGALRVGPRSAGAHPGPACYRRGASRQRSPTPTCCSAASTRAAPWPVACGWIARLPEAALGRLATALGLDLDRTAAGIVEVVESHMDRAIRRVSIEEGADPRQAVLVAFGGAGGLHASALARRLEMAGLVIPAHSGVFSALGMLLSPPRQDSARSTLLRRGDDLDGAVDRLRSAAQGAAMPGGQVRTLVDVRYLGQSHETAVPYAAGDGWSALAGRFHRLHHRRNGFSRPEDEIEVTTIRTETEGRPAVDLAALPTPRPDGGEPHRGSRPVRAPDGPTDAQIWWRPSLSVGEEIVGPAVIEEPVATSYLAAGERARVHETGALEVTW